jgi:peptide/nickel transport system substrate-binding protein
MMRKFMLLLAVILPLSFAVACTAPDDEAAPSGESEQVDGAGDDAAMEDEGDEADEGMAEEGDEADEGMAEEGMADGPIDVLAFDDTAQKGTGTLVIGQGQEPETLYRYGGSMLAATHIQNSLYESIEGLTFDYQPVILTQLPKLENEGSGATLELVTVEAGGQYIDPETQEVVTATETVADLPQLSVVFEMVDGVTWQDGTPVTAEDSVFAYNISCDPDTATSKYLCERTASYEATGESTVQWTGLPGYTDQTYFTNFTMPLPRHQPGSDGTPMEEMSAIDIAEDQEFTRNPWSYGPFMIEEWSDGDFIKLVRNEYYWRADEGLPILDSVIHKFIKDSNSLLAALRTGDIDVATQDGLDISQFDALEDGMNAGEITPYYVVGTVWEHIDFNFDPVDDRPAIGACKDVRKAIAYATDRETMVDVIQQGKTKVQNTYIPDVHWAYPPEDMLTTYPYEPETAAQLLEDLGFVDDDGDVTTPRVAAEDITCTITTDIDGNTKDQVILAGTPLEMNLNTTQGNVMREETTLLFQQNMSDVGVGINLEYLPANVYFGDGPDGPLFGRRFDLGEFAWLTGVQPPVGLYYCTEIPSEENSWSGQNETGYCNPEYDAVSKQAENTLERPEALPLYHEAQRIFSDELPVLPLFARVKVMATRPNVVNFMPDPTVNSETWNIETWGFAPEE